MCDGPSSESEPLTSAQLAEAMQTMALLNAALPAVGGRCTAAPCAAAPCLGSRTALRGSPVLEAASRGTVSVSSSRGVVQVVAVRRHTSAARIGAVCSAVPRRDRTRPENATHAWSLSSQSREVGVGIMGNKAGMTSYFTDKGMQVPVTVIALLPGNVVTQARVSPAAGQAAACCPRRRHQRWTRPAAWRRAAGCVRRWPGSRV